MHTQKINLLLAITFIALLTSCLTAKKIDRQVAKQYQPILASKTQQQENNIFVTSTLTSSGDQISTTESKTSNVLPLIFYWQWDYTNTCTINPQIPINNFKAAVNNNATLKSKLAGQKLQISVSKIPHTFQILDKAHLIALGVVYHSWDNISMKSTDTEIVVSYKVLNNNVETKNGTISIPNFDDKKSLPMFKNLNKALKEFLIQFDENITSLSKLVADKLASEL